MKKGLLASTARRMMTAPVGTAMPLTIGVAMTDAATVRITIEARSFLLPDEQAAMRAALDAVVDKARPVVLSVGGPVAPPRRIVTGLIHIVQSAGFTQLSVVTEPAAG